MDLARASPPLTPKQVRAKAALHADVPLLEAIAAQASSYMGGLQAQLMALTLALTLTLTLAAGPTLALP